MSWLWPFAATPDRSTGWEFEVNDFEGEIIKLCSSLAFTNICYEEAGVSWPPPDPDRIPLPTISSLADHDDRLPQVYESTQEEIEAFNRRQMEDLKRQKPYAEVQRRKRFHERCLADEDAESDTEQLSPPTYGKDSDEGEESWRNSEGERLRDFGVDEDVEFYDEEDVPLAVLIQRRKGQQS